MQPNGRQIMDVLESATVRNLAEALTGVDRRVRDHLPVVYGVLTARRRPRACSTPCLRKQVAICSEEKTGLPRDLAQASDESNSHGGKTPRSNLPKETQLIAYELSGRLGTEPRKR